MEEPIKEKKKKKKHLENLGEIQKSTSFQLESSTKVTKLDTSKWPLLLKVSGAFVNFLTNQSILDISDQKKLIKFSECCFKINILLLVYNNKHTTIFCVVRKFAL